MKQTVMRSAIACLVILATTALAQQPEGGSPATTAPTAQSAPNPKEFDKQMAQMQENMKKMQELMDKIAQTQDPEERHKLLREHWELMQGGMGMMHHMWGAGLMGCCGGPMMSGRMGGPMMGWTQMHGYYSKLTPEQMKQRQYMTDRYLGMQQMMMDHMMWHQHWVMAPPDAKQ